MPTGFNTIFLKMIFFFISCFWIFWTGSFAWALPQPESQPQQNLRVFLEGSYFNTTANYDRGGGRFTSLGNGRYYRLYEGNLGAEFWVLENLSAVAQVGVARAQSYDGIYSRSNTGVTEGLVGVRYLMRKGFFNVTPELLFSYPFQRVDSETDDVLFNEGAMKIQGGSWLEIPLGRFQPYLHGGLLYQDDGRASYFIYTVGTAWTPRDFRFYSEVYGSTVVIDDEHSDQRSVRDLTTTRVDGGSWKFYAVNPTLLGLRVGASMDLAQSVRLGVGFDKTLNGDNSAAGWTALIRLETFFGIGNGLNSSPVAREPRVLEPSQDSQKFVPEQPQYDPALFHEPKTESITTNKAKKKSHRKVKKKVRPQDIDKALEDVQKSLER